MSTLVGYEGFVDECGKLLTQRLDEFAQNGEVIDLSDWLQKYAFDVISAITVWSKLHLNDITILILVSTVNDSVFLIAEKTLEAL